jgi:regulator of replication initiation timing
MSTSNLQDKYQTAQLTLAHLNQVVGENSVELERLKSKRREVLRKNRLLTRKNKELKEYIVELEEKLLEAEQNALHAQLEVESKENMIQLLTESRSFKIGKMITNYIKSIRESSLFKIFK